MKFNQRSLSLYLIASFVILQACKREEIPPKVREIPAIIEPYIELFEQEAASRGLDITIDNLIVEFEEDLRGGDAAGLCTFASESSPTPHIRLDTTSFNWQNNEFHRELLVFHELGHCILNRLHRDDELPNGNFTSIMRSTGEQLYGGNLNYFKRDYYLDELFDEGTPAPDWATDIPEYAAVSEDQRQPILIEDFDNNANGWQIGVSSNTRSEISGGLFTFESRQANSAFFTANNVPTLDQTQDFEVEARLRIADGANSVMLQWAGSGANDLSFFGFTEDSIVFIGNWENGVSISRSLDTFAPSEFHTLTVRKQGDRYFLFFDETYFDVMEFESYEGSLIAFYVGPLTTLQVDYIYVNQLTQ